MHLMRQYHSEDFPFNKDMIKVTNVFSLRVETMTGKRRKKENGEHYQGQADKA